ncbi:hypothetical protein M0R45_029642 [Rubus argutus]|uniref:Uncharacterized protein n=1 Tax=Rubus argutus TaxID=59490 RepID=A0AAW1WB40_RUBAR
MNMLLLVLPNIKFSNEVMYNFLSVTTEYLGFTSYPPAYLTQEAIRMNILIGVNFVSVASGYYNWIAWLWDAISLDQQLNYYNEYQNRVVNMVGQAKANAIFFGAIHLLRENTFIQKSLNVVVQNIHFCIYLTSSFMQNYYFNPLLRVYSPDHFSDILIRSYSTFIQSLYGLGPRRIGVTSLPPTGCLLGAITQFGSGGNQCNIGLNQDAILFNSKLNNTSQTLQKSLPGLKLVVFDIYQPLLDMITNPSENEFSLLLFRTKDTNVKFLIYSCGRVFESRRVCCGTSTVEISVLCNSRSIGTCNNATGHVFWDGFHPSEAANQVLAGDLLEQGFYLIS